MSRIAIRSHLAAMTLAAAASGLLAGSVMAAPPAQAPGHGPAHMHEGQGHKGPRGWRQDMRDGMFIPGLGPLSKAQIGVLKLDEKQQAALKAAQDAQRELRDAVRQGGERHELLKAQLDSGKLDPRALMTQEDKQREAFGVRAKQVRDKWLAVWDSLNETQRGQIATMLKERQARMEQHRAKMEAHRAKTPGADAPPPPPAN